MSISMMLKGTLANRSRIALLIASTIGLGLALVLSFEDGPAGREERRVLGPDRVEGVALLDAGSLAERRTDAVEPLGYRASPGDVFCFLAKADMRLEFQGVDALLPESDGSMGSVPATRIEMQGLLCVRVDSYDATARAYELCVSILDPRVSALGVPADDEWMNDAWRPLRVRLRNDGVVLAYSFAPDSQKTIRSFLVDLFANTHSFPLVSERDAWETSELFDHTGRASARLWSRAEAPSTVERSKVAYLSPADASALALPTIVSSSASATFGEGWVAAVDVHEVVAADLGEVVVQSSLDLTLRRTERSAAAGRSIECGGDAWQRTGPCGGGGVELQRTEVSNWRAALPPLLAQIQEFVAQDQLDTQEYFDAWASLGNLIHDHPLALDEILPLIDGQPFERWMFSVIGAIGHAGELGCADAATALGGILSHDNPLEHRMAAYLAAFQLDETAPLIADLVLERSRWTNVPEEKVETMLLVGHLARVLEPSSALFQRVTADLERMENWAQENGRMEDHVRARGNAHDYEALIRLATAVDGGVRAVACEELAAAGSGRARKVLMDRAENDAELGVRLAAIEGLGAGEVDRETAVFLMRIGRLAADDAVEDAVVDALRSAWQQPGVEEFLRLHGRLEEDEG